jgi:diacylglycerol kinase family enzyme
LDTAEGLVVAAGGDGTIRAVAAHILASSGVARRVPLVIVPMGTANNIARSLGIQNVKPGDLLGLAAPEKRTFDVGRMAAPWGDDIFLEGAGFGFFADLLSAYDPGQGKSVLRGLATLLGTARAWQSYPCRMVLDGEEVTGDFALVEVMNIRAIGPRLRLAPAADPCDGLLDVATVQREEMERLAPMLLRGVAGTLDRLPGVQYRQVRSLQLAWSGFPLHIDAEIRPAAGWTSPAFGEVTIDVLPQSLELWLPSTYTTQSVSRH